MNAPLHCIKRKAKVNRPLLLDIINYVRCSALVENSNSTQAEQMHKILSLPTLSPEGDTPNFTVTLQHIPHMHISCLHLALAVSYGVATIIQLRT
ncbi:hypothetical protein WA026_017001, partial [Henosepilachna vigintioctopunctata]